MKNYCSECGKDTETICVAQVYECTECKSEYEHSLRSVRRDSVKIGGMTFRIVMQDVSGTSVDGSIIYAQSTIRIDDQATLDYRAAVLWHEMLHAILTQSGHEHDEKLIDALAYGIVQILRDNPVDMLK